MATGRHRGWDKQAVNGIAADLYGGLAEMFAAHGWSKGDRTYGQIAPKLAKQTYGSVESFARSHEGGLADNLILSPMAALDSDPPEVWLTSLYGFTPDSWGFVGWTQEAMRTSFLNKSRPGALVVIYAASGAEHHLRKRVLGVQQVSHRTGTKWDFLHPSRLDAERGNPDRRERWVHAVQVIRAWRIPEEQRPAIEEFAFDTYSHDNAQMIGARGARLTRAEAQGILKLDLVPTRVFGRDEWVDEAVPIPAGEALRPSRPGPVSRSAYVVREAEGPKHLYILRLEGDADAFLGYPADGRVIVKVGFSGSPTTRLDAFNRALPKCAYAWTLDRSTHSDGRDAFPSCNHALAGENAMKMLLEREGDSLGGEFFLAKPSAIARAWLAAIQAAENWKS